MDRGLEHLAARRPELHASLRFWRTGEALPSLSGVAAVVFWMSDPLRERRPRCFKEAMEVAGEARSRGLALVNPPESLSHTIKTVQADLLSAGGIPAAPHRRAASRSDLPGLAEELGYPVIVRSDLEHGQRKMRVFRSPRELEAAKDRKFAYPAAVTPFVETRATGDSLRARWYHKKRAFVFGRHVVPHELFFSSSGIVGSRTCTFGTIPGWRSCLPGERRRLRECIEADLDYWRHGDPHADLMRRTNAALGLDWSAIDYSDTRDGGAVVWEANPLFHLPAPEEMYLPAARLMAEREVQVFDAVGDFFDDLRGGSA
ncbi:MAG: hypothetical protein QNK04_22350 [Myxococcota bacterium]|nr:hypothetical protein [Myxococcota bacterium]